MKRMWMSAGLAALLAGCAQQSQPNAAAPAPATPEVRTQAEVDADNTAVNARDVHAAAKTPIDQNENQPDIDITANIRRRVVDSNMSINAQNVKIITQDGRVMLRGPVKTADELQRIEAIAVDVAGAGQVDNQLQAEANP